MRQLFIRRRWALLFLNVAAGLALAPFLYWDAIFMRVVLALAHEEAILLGLNTLNALGGLVLLPLAAVVLGGCMSAVRAILASKDVFMPTQLRRSISATAKTSLVAGGIVGLSLGAMRVGLLSLAMQMPSGWLRWSLAAVLLLQFLVALPFCLLAFCQNDTLQRRPSQALAQAGRDFVARPLRWFGLLAVTALPAAVLFMLPWPLFRLAGFLGVLVFLLSPMMVAWQKSCPESKNTRVSFVPAGLAMLGFGVLTTLALLLPFWLQGGQAGYVVQSTLGETLAFIARQATLEADNGAFRNLLSASSVWPLLVAALVGSACCILVAYACASYRFRLRKLMFAAVVLLQLLPMLSRYSALEQLLRQINLQFPPVFLGLAWVLLYIVTAWLLYRHFARMRPALQRAQVKYPGVRAFFYFALPRARLYVVALTALATLGAWGDALAPFWLMRDLGAFSLAGYVWQSFFL